VRADRARLNRLWIGTGAAVADRYHVHVLQTPREVRNALRYVLENARHHGAFRGGFDRASSAPWFDGWRADARELATAAARAGPAFVTAARTWLLRTGWRRQGRLVPGAAG
jgi:hypothetical protein